MGDGHVAAFDTPGAQTSVLVSLLGQPAVSLTDKPRLLRLGHDVPIYGQRRRGVHATAHRPYERRIRDPKTRARPGAKRPLMT